MKVAVFIAQDIDYIGEGLFLECMNRMLLELGSWPGDAKNYGGCLCAYRKDHPQGPFDFAFAHPHRNDECYRKIREVVENNPDSDFVIFADYFKKRVDIIGNHPNVRYIMGQNPNDQETVEWLKMLKRKLKIKD